MEELVCLEEMELKVQQLRELVMVKEMAKDLGLEMEKVDYFHYRKSRVECKHKDHTMFQRDH